MGLKRKLFIVALTLAAVFACVFGFAGCSGCNNQDDPVSQDDPSHTYAEGWTGDDDYHWHAATDGSDVVSEKALHDWQLSTDKSVAATCSAAGVNVYECSVCKDTKREVTAQLTHVWSTEVKTEDPTCIAGGRKYKTCTNAGCDATSTVEYLPAAGHKPASAATCTQASVCSVCDVTITPALGHDYQVVSTVAATCSADGSRHYACSHDGCEEEYDETYETKLPHNIVWDEEGVIEYKNTAELCYTITYTGTCANDGCDHTETKSTDVTSHVYTTAITTVATCSADGTKTLTCKNCEYHTTETYKDANAHTWNSGTVTNGITTFTCTHNGAHTKQSVVSSDTVSVFSADTVKAAGEVTLDGTSIKLDDGVKNALPQGDVTLGAEKLSINELEGVELDRSDAEIIRGTVFNLTLNAGGQYVSNLGGTVSVTVPYEISEDEDPNNIVILYINGDKLEEVAGVYSNGFVTFETTHFSYYTVTKMDPAERCEKFGHAFTTYHQEPTCLLAGYDVHFCTRCGIYEREDIAALGHDWETQKTAATCLVNGKTHYECKRCEVEYDIVIPAYGHVWEATVYSAATCQASGHATYKCELCEETYNTTIPQTAHTLVTTKVEATCTTSGYTRSECIICGHVNETDHVPALGHTEATRVVEPTCTVDGFTQTYCTVCGVEISKSNVVKAKGHSMSNGVCTVCGYGCSHEYVAGEVVEPACETEGYVLYTCTKCNSSYKGEIKKALGHKYNADECEVCHKLNPASRDFYLNLVNTALNGTVSITLKEFSFSLNVVTYVNSELTGKELEVAAQQLDVTKLTLTLSAGGDIIGAGEGVIELKVNTGSDNIETVSMDCDFVIKDGTLYLVISSDNEQVLPAMYMSMELDYVFGTMSNGALNYAAVKEYLLWYNGKVSPVLNKLISTNADFVVPVLRFLLNNAFVGEINADSNTYTLDFLAIERLNELFNTTTAKDILESMLGEGVYARIPALVTSVLNLTPAQALTLVQNYGIDKKQIFAAVDAFMLLLKGEEFDSEEWLDEFLSGKVSEDGELTYNDITVAELLIIYTQAEATKSEYIAQTVEMVTAMLDEYEDKTVYEIIADLINKNSSSQGPDYGVPPTEGNVDTKPMDEDVFELTAEVLYETVCNYISQYLPMLRNGVVLSFSTDKAGNVISAKIAANIKDFVIYGDEVGNDGETYRHEEVLDVKGEAQFTFGGSTTVDDAIISAINAAKPKFERNSVITAYSNKHLETRYDEQFPNLFTYDRGEEMLVYTDVRGNIVKIVVTSEIRHRDIYSVYSYYVDCYEYLEKRVEEYDFNCGSAMMISKNYCGSIDMYDIMGMRTSYTEYTIYNRKIHGRTLVVISDRIEDYRLENNGAYYSGKSFYYDTVKGTYSADDPHRLDNLTLNEEKSKIECGGYYYMECEDCGYSYKRGIYHLDNSYHTNVKYELADGSKSCEDGVIVKYVCRECEEVVDSYITHWHDTYLKDTIDCSEYSNTCKHTINLYGCACGEYLHTNLWNNDYWNYFYGDEFGEGFDSIRRLGDYSYVVNGKEQMVTVYACVVVDNSEEGTCGFNFAYYTDYTKDSTCYATHTEKLVFNVTIDNEKRVVTGGTVYNGVLPYYYDYQHNPETTRKETANGYIYESKCVDCGLKVDKTEHTEIRENGLLVSQTEIHTFYKSDAEDNTEEYVEKQETVYTYDAKGQTLSETRTITSYDGAMLPENIGGYNKRILTWTYNDDDSMATSGEERQDFNEDNILTRLDKYEYEYVDGERFNKLYYRAQWYPYDNEGNYTEEPTRWTKVEYDYSNGYCSPMIKESTQSGESPVRPGVVSHRTDGQYITYPTCTQLGTMLCKFCHQEVQDTDRYFEGHHYNEYGVCEMCGLENGNGFNGWVILEDLSYTSVGEYVIGYYNRESAEYSIQITLINLDVEEYEEDYEVFLNMYDVYYRDSNEGIEELNYFRSGTVTFSVGQIEDYALENGIENYMIRVYFVSERYGSTLDYAITIDAHNWVEGTLIYSHYNYETGERIIDETFTVQYCSVCGIVCDYGYLNLRYDYEDEEGMYHYNGYNVNYLGMGKDCELIVSTPIANIEIPPVDETL